MNQPYATLTLASALREMFGVQMYKNNARALLLRILSILNLDWLQHARSVRGVYEVFLMQHEPAEFGNPSCITYIQNVLGEPISWKWFFYSFFYWRIQFLICKILF